MLAFIDSQPGLAEVCECFPDQLAEYAPQLTIPSFGGRWESVFDELLANSVAEYTALRAKDSKCGTALTTDGRSPLCDGIFALRHPTFGNYEPEHIACGFVQGNGAGLGPVVRAYAHFDYAIWFLSEASSWLPCKHREVLTEGMKCWPVWIDFQNSDNPAFERTAETGQLLESMLAARSAKNFRLATAAKRDLLSRTEAARAFLKLPETAKELVDAFIEAGFIQAWFEAEDRRKKRMRKSSRPAPRRRRA